jgi:hypothetical protein
MIRRRPKRQGIQMRPQRLRQNHPTLAITSAAASASSGSAQDRTIRAPSSSASISASLNISGGRSNPGRNIYPMPAAPSIGTPLAIRSCTSR